MIVVADTGLLNRLVLIEGPAPGRKEEGTMMVVRRTGPSAFPLVR